MRSKRIHFSGIIPMLALGIMFVLAACEDNKDLYNPERVQEEAKKAFPVKDIDPNQTWETSAVCNASVSVNEKDGETYTIKVYTSNPYNVNSSDVFLLAKTTVANGKTANFKFDIPAALQYVYVMKVNSEGYSSAVPVAVTDGSMNVTFGGESTETRMATTRGGGSFFTAETPTDDIFPIVTPPSNYGNFKEYWKETNKVPYLLENETVEDVNPWMGADFYIKGEVTITNIKSPGNGAIMNYYLLSGATLTLTMNEFDNWYNSVFVIEEGAKLIAENTVLTGEKGSKYFNKGTMIASGLEIYNGCVYNSGIINTTERIDAGPEFFNINGKIKASNINITNSYVYNSGTIETRKVLLNTATTKFCNATGAYLNISELEIQGNGHFLNETDAIVENSGATILNCSGGSWENAGHYTTSTMNISAWNDNVKNSCWLTVKNELKLGDAGVYNDSYIECGSLYMNNGTVYMAENSFFNVKEEAKFGYNTDGFIAKGDALLKMGTAIPETPKKANTIGYHGKLYIASDNHFSDSMDGSAHCINMDGGAVFAGADNADIEIPDSECNPGYEGTADEDKDDDDDDDDSDDKYPLLSYAYAFEDLVKPSMTDYDFNDVVLYITAPYGEDGNRAVKVTLKAAGASKQLTVFFKDLYSGTSPIAQNIFGRDVHKVFGVEPGTLVNTGTPVDTEAKTATIEPVTVTVKVSDGFNITDHGDFYIVDENGMEVHIPNFTPGFTSSNVPYALRVAGANWRWPKERIGITDAYKDFIIWAGDVTSEIDWYNRPENGNVY